MIKLDSRLQQDCSYLGQFPLCHLLLMNDANYPWTILVPDRQYITEIYQLSESEQMQLQKESCFLGNALMELFSGDKLNVAALGNVVAQLHIHHIVRYENDAAWPAPVWGKVAAKPYEPDDLRRVSDKVCKATESMLIG